MKSRFALQVFFFFTTKIAFTVEIEGDFEQFFLCHCEQCRKDTGSAHAANLFANNARIKWLSGQNNITTGHPTGDRVIMRIVQAIKSCTRSGDIVGRLGGDEFCVVLVGCAAEQCIQIANRITQEVTLRPDVLTPAPSGIDISVSIGVCTGLNADDSFCDAYQWADAMPYKAKKRGGNCAVAE